jgi:hypothetical protein
MHRTLRPLKLQYQPQRDHRFRDIRCEIGELPVGK